MTAGLPESGELLEGKYRIERVIGEGAWGEVLEGINVRIKRRVAIKVLKAQYASNPAMVGRFEREALASTHIESPHVVQIFDAGVLSDGRPYMVMEFLVGEDLGKRIEAAPQHRLALVEAIGFCIQAARGLGSAHAAGIFHRDMKPSNIVVAQTKNGREVAKIVDFGISKLLDQEATSNTQTGTIMGSPVYMSPEQARGSKNTDHRSDIYSLGVVLYECITGRTPFVADSFNELLFKIALEEAPTVKSLRPDIDDELNDIICKATARQPEDRYQTANELEAALIGFLKNKGEAADDWATDTGPRDLHASPTRGRSLAGDLTASPTPGAPAGSAAVTMPEERPVGKDTGTSLSKTADPALPAAPASGGNKKLVYVVGAAALVVVGVVGASSLRSPPKDPNPATSAIPEAPKPSASVAPTPSVTAATSTPAADTSAASAADAAAAPASATAETTTKPIPDVTHAPTARTTPTQTSKPATSASTSVGGRTIRTDF